MSIKPFKIDIPDSELESLRQKLLTTRLPTYSPDWTEENGITTEYVDEARRYWLDKYDWRREEAKINELPQFTTPIDVDDGFGTLDIHFLHSPATNDTDSAIPLLFLHGWPGSFIEVTKGLAPLNRAGFHVVAPSLPGYGFSGYPKKKGFDHARHAEVFDKLMLRLGYDSYVVQGGDWGSDIAHATATLYPDHVRACHQNMLKTRMIEFPPGKEPRYTDRERAAIDRFWKHFVGTNNAYSQIQAQRPLNLGFAMHDSPVGLFVWFADKLITWSDGYPWTFDEMITFTLLHYFPGPTPGFVMYMENDPSANMVEGSWADQYLEVPCGYSAFPKELCMMPRSWADLVSNCVFYKEHDSGGHFAMYEKPELLVEDMKEFFRSVWKT